MFQIPDLANFGVQQFLTNLAGFPDFGKFHHQQYYYLVLCKSWHSLISRDSEKVCDSYAST